jgi:hypothetical protein
MSSVRPARSRFRPFERFSILSAAALFGAILAGNPAWAIKTVFVIALENTNWTQPQNPFSGGQQQIFQNPAAPFLNSLVQGTAQARINGVITHISAQTAYATAYHNVLASTAGATGLNSIHPSEPNYLWSEAGSNLGVYSDNQPYQANAGTNQNTPRHLSALLMAAGKTWRSYQEDINLAGSGNRKTDTPLPRQQWTVPLTNLSGTSSTYSNAYNGSHQYDYAAKHNPMLFFSDTNGGNDASPANPMAQHYAPLQQLETDLKNNAVAHYNWITPNQFNDMHTALAGDFSYNGVTYGADPALSGAKKIAQGDNFLSRIIPMIMASRAYRDDGAIIIWMDESMPDGIGNLNDFQHTIPEIVISPLAHPNVHGLPFASPINLTHSDDLRTMQAVFGVWQGGYLGDAAQAVGLESLFAPGAVAKQPRHQGQGGG